MNLEPGAGDVCTASTDERSPNEESPEPSRCAAPVSSAGSTVSESTGAMEAECQTESTMDSAPKPDVEPAEEQKDESVSCGPVPSEEQEDDLPEMSLESFNVIKAAIFNFKCSQNPTSSKEVI